MNEWMSNSRQRNKKFLIPFTLFSAYLFSTHIRPTNASSLQPQSHIFLLCARCRCVVLLWCIVLKISIVSISLAFGARRNATIHFVGYLIYIQLGNEEEPCIFSGTLSARLVRAIFTTFNSCSSIRGVLTFGRRAAHIESHSNGV